MPTTLNIFFNLVNPFDNPVGKSLIFSGLTLSDKPIDFLITSSYLLKALVAEVSTD